jgi:Ca2+:H+ antiporter
MYDPPGDGNALVPINAPPEIIEEEEHLARAMPDVNVWAACATIAVTVALVAVTAEFLVESIEHFRVRDPQDESIEHSRTHALQDEWFGLILLPLVSFAADGAVATIFFVRYMFGLFFGRPEPPAQLAKGRSIDMSIQFTIFWCASSPVSLRAPFDVLPCAGCRSSCCLGGGRTSR